MRTRILGSLTAIDERWIRVAAIVDFSGSPATKAYSHTLVSMKSRWLPLMQEQITRLRQSFQRSTGRIAQLGDDDAGQLLAEATELRDDIDRVIAALQRRDPMAEER